MASGFGAHLIVRALESRYLFVDGNYLSCIYRSGFEEVIDKKCSLDFGAIRTSLHADKAFYYDSIDRSPRKSESGNELEMRIREKSDYLQSIRKLPCWHVFEGSVNSSPDERKRRQKQVDVLLACDALNHAFSKNMSKATLIAGDLDFKPVVDSLVRLGCEVTIMATPTTVAEGLRYAADIFHIIDFAQFLNWTPRRQYDGLELPINHGIVPLPNPGPNVKEGMAGTTKIVLEEMDGKRFKLYLDQGGAQFLGYSHGGSEPLLKLARAYFGKVNL